MRKTHSHHPILVNIMFLFFYPDSFTAERSDYNMFLMYVLKYYDKLPI